MILVGTFLISVPHSGNSGADFETWDSGLNVGMAMAVTLESVVALALLAEGKTDASA